MNSEREVTNDDLREIKKLTENEEYQKALEKHIWFHNASKSSPSMAGVRLSYAISDWVKLGNNYPPALEALINIKEQHKTSLLEGNHSFNNFSEIHSINHTLKNDNETLELFLELEEKYPENSKHYYIIAEKLLITNEKYEICSKYIGDPILKLENLRHHRETIISFSKNDAKTLKLADNNFNQDIVSLIKTLIAINRKDDALEIQQKALEYFENDTIKHAI